MTGTGFDTTAENNVITIGDISCTTLNVSADGTTIFCSPGMGPAGLTFIKVNVADRGYATGTIIYIFFFDIISWSPLRVGLGGKFFLYIYIRGLTIQKFVHDTYCDILDK